MDPIEATGLAVPKSKGEEKRKKKSHVRPPKGYLQQEVDLSKTPMLFFPPGKEMLFLGIYFIILPYITGLLFLFFVISKANPELFTSLDMNSTSFLMVWATGYEILAAIIVLWIIKNAVMYSVRNAQATSSASSRKKTTRKRYPH